MIFFSEINHAKKLDCECAIDKMLSTFDVYI